MTEYIEALRNLAVWLEDNELPEGITIQAEGGKYIAKLTIFGHGNAEQVCDAIGGAWTAGSSNPAFWSEREEPFLGFTEVTVFE